MMTKKQKIRLGIVSGACAVALGILIALNCIAASFNNVLITQFGKVGETSAVGYSDYDSLDDALDAFSAEMNERVVEEGAVLLKNDGALPLDKGSEKISVFGMSSTLWMTLDKIKTAKDAVFANALEDYGFGVNGTLRAFYNRSSHTDWGIGDNKGDGSSAGSWQIDEVPQSEYTDEVKASYADYNDAAIVVFSRSSGEGADLPRNMDRFGGSAQEHYLQLSQNEKDMLQAVNEAGFKKVIVLLHSANPMQLDFLDDYDIDAVIWAPGTGAGSGGINALCKLIAGDANFSGRTVDTYSYDNLSAPAMQNFGDYRFVDASGSMIDASSNGSGHYSYVNYSEGIYIGYKYYETRYEDVVLKQGNAGGFHYDEVVAYPFGYGFSYTDFTWSGFEGAYDEANDEFTFKVTVQNTGDKAGKEVVQLYMQSPYTAYDIENKVEKAAVQLVGFAKTEELAKDEEQTVEIKVDGQEMRAYDEFGAGTYILEAGQYYFTAAGDAHEAINNILAQKGKTTADGMTADGNADLVYGYEVSETDDEVYATGEGGGEIKNQFTGAALVDAVYLSRSDWSVMENNGLEYATGVMSGVSNTTNAAGEAKTAQAAQALIDDLKATGWEASGNPNAKDSYEAITTGVATDLKLADMAGLDFEDEKWSELLNSLSLETLHAIYQSSAYGTAEISSINKPTAYVYDGPEGCHNVVGPAEILLAATFNKQLVWEYGEINGDLAVLDNYTGWYAPATNIHRTPFSGRNYEYFSEDSFLSGTMSVAMTQGAASKGLNAVPKHMALNDQETNRDANGGVATYCREQAIREIYLRPFEDALTEGKAMGVMSAMNRIGSVRCRSNYALNINVLRGEWGYEGFVITDYNVISTSESEACLAGGCNLQLTGMANPLPETSSQGVQYLLRDSLHRTLYFCANSRLVAGIGDNYSAGVPVYVLLLIAIDAVVVAYIVCGILLNVYNIRFANRAEVTAGMKKKRLILNVVYYALLAAFIIAVLVIFFAWGLPLLQQAFKIS